MSPFKRDLEFYSLETQSIDFCEIIREINKMKNKSLKDGGKILESSSFDIGLFEFKEDSFLCEGLIARSNRDDLPLAGNLYTRIIRFLTLNKKDGLIDMTYFCYIKDLKILCLLPARKGVKWGTFKEYIRRIHPIKTNFDMFPLFNKKTMEIYNKMGSITLINAEINIGNNSSPDSVAVKNSPLKPLIANVKNSNASRINLEVFNEKRKGGLKLSIKKLVGYLIDLGILYDSESIKIKGSLTPDENDIVIDLIKNRYKLQVNLGDNSRYLIFKECSKKVRKIIDTNLDEIKGLLI